MHDQGARIKRCLCLTRDFENSRLEKELLAVAYEQTVPIVSRRTSASPTLLDDERCCPEIVLGQAAVSPSSTIKEGKVA
jgi:hypothetical protein